MNPTLINIFISQMFLLQRKSMLIWANFHFLSKMTKYYERIVGALNICNYTIILVEIAVGSLVSECGCWSPTWSMIYAAHNQHASSISVIDGYSYERKAIESWFHKGNTRSPMTNSELSNQTLLHNLTLRALIHREIQSSGESHWWASYSSHQSLVTS